MKQPDEWNTVIDRWYALIMGILMLIMFIVYAIIGAPLLVLLFISSVTILSFAVQLEYEMKAGIFS